MFGNVIQSIERRSALTVAPDLFLGILIWFVAILAMPLSLASVILIFAPLVIVPLGARIVQTELRWPKYLIAPSAILLVLSFAFETGVVAALLAGPWFLVTCLFGMEGLRRAIDGLKRRHVDLGICAAFLFLPVGGIWTLFARAGYQPMGFDATIVLLTGVHFHYAGFALPLLASLSAKERPGRLSQLTLFGVAIGVPLVGLGITFSPIVEVAAAITLVTACIALAYLQTRIAIIRRQATISMLMMVSSMSLLAAMILAAIYAIGEFRGDRILQIEQMVPLHGIANAFGFSLCGLLAWYTKTTDR